jgi:ParB/RepB/Spo0J family partition protein
MTILELPLNSLDLRYGGLRVRRPRVEKRLIASIEEVGQQSPVIVVRGGEPGQYVLIEGRKRVRALKRLKADVVKAAVWETEAAEALVAAYQLQDGTRWNALEEGWLVWELVRQVGLSLGEAGGRLQRSKAWVSGRLGLVESLPEAVLEGVRSGKIGAYTATRHLLAFARANASDCEMLAAKIAEQELSSREVKTLWRYYSSATREGKRRMLEDPGRFLKAREAAKEIEAASLDPEAGRCLKNLELIGNVSLGLARSLAQAVGYDAPEQTRERLKRAWAQTRERWGVLEKTAASVFEVQASGGEQRKAVVAWGQETSAHAG